MEEQERSPPPVQVGQLVAYSAEQVSHQTTVNMWPNMLSKFFALNKFYRFLHLYLSTTEGPTVLDRHCQSLDKCFTEQGASEKIHGIRQQKKNLELTCQKAISCMVKQF